MSESDTKTTGNADADERTGVEIVYDLLDAANLDYLSALGGALRYFAVGTGRECSFVQIEKVSFSDENMRLTVVVALEP